MLKYPIMFICKVYFCIITIITKITAVYADCTNHIPSDGCCDIIAETILMLSIS